MNSCVQGLFRTYFLALLALFALSACGGGGGGGGGTPPPSAGNVTVSGRITFERPPFNAQRGQGLDLDNPVESPARQVVVEAIAANSSSILASTTTNESGDYSLNVPANRTMFIRAKAQMRKSDTAPTWNFRVLNNTNSDALYALDGDSFDSGAANSVRNLLAATGWGTTNYTGLRAAAPFAILDTVYSATELILSVDATAVFPPLDLYWSATNRTASPLCPDLGNVETTFFTRGGTDRCSTSMPLPAGIYILGAFPNGVGDTDEFDQHVIAHEFGHYFEFAFSRSDSIGGRHTDIDALDFRVAFGEGWGNAFSAMTLDDPVYRDSQSIGTDFGFDFENDATTLEGWFSALSISEILWDIYDDASEPGDTVSLGFGPVYEVMTGSQVTTDAFTSIYTFADAIRAANPAQSAGIGTLLSNEFIFGAGPFGAGETNDGADPVALPIYHDLALNVQLDSICTHGSEDGSINKLGNRMFFRFVNTVSRPVSINATGALGGDGSVAADDPDIFIFRRGEIVDFGIEEGPSETVQIPALPAGTYTLEIYDFGIFENPDDTTLRCMTVSISG